MEKEKATHSSVIAWRIPGMGEPGGLPSMGSHRPRGHRRTPAGPAAGLPARSSVWSRAASPRTGGPSPPSDTPAGSLRPRHGGGLRGAAPQPRARGAVPRGSQPRAPLLSASSVPGTAAAT